MPSAQSQSLIHEYSSVYTNLQAGKRDLIGTGIDRLLLNRYIIDAAADTGEVDNSAVLASVSLDKVSAGDSASDKQQYCRGELIRLVSLQEELNTMQRVAREKGISSSLLTIVGQAAIQSPDDHGASVIRQLNHLLNDDDSPPVQPVSQPESKLTVDAAANDAAGSDAQRMTAVQQLTVSVIEHWRPLLVDGMFCLLASFFAIKLVS